MARFFQPKKKTQLETKHQSVLVERMDHNGAGIAYQKNKPVFIDGALPGEQVVIQLTESKSKFSRAKLIKLLKPSELRLKPFCKHFNQCGGCHLQHLGYSSQVEHKSQSLTHLMSQYQTANTEVVEPIVGDETGYRRRARISLFVDKKTQQLQFGFRKKQSKQIENITDCAVLDPRLNVLLPKLKSLLNTFSNLTSLGHVELVLGDIGPVMVLRHLKPLVEKDEQALIALAKAEGATLYTMPETDKLIRLVGEAPAYSETGVTLPFEPNHFIQVNQKVNQQMVAQAIEWLEPQADERVLDLFCGLGNFSLPIAQQSAFVVGVEGVDEMVQQATSNATLNQLSNTEFYQANLEEELSSQPWAKERFDKILLDPARAGASGIVDQISGLGAKRVVYVSCNPATLARDSESLEKQGYQLAKLGMLDMFPHTSHLESMALFIKA
ncbi:23S rRNA (uracil(1939)-C(5))-methyltransferase RlmD [Vibrio splendidus]|uniref:23S rRNA (uracil(1939)-C(5))-methyltransferase RlmD n=1 Tax=Vibrio splendidus TaxID=29497 RepID=UPI000C83366D|nr:23S rRNA (uracil(1939)-C(5))-methyltransferase RlmD [Vibrio splendidus]PMI59518.1 23S rRNA (uracil(1939)-C(5))-methyltransferase [Vibrio splendidus]PMJ37580.1 23S rRNA (uracil(1939)-C(5))-methyltransferase [Vibrio splendidus]